MPAKLEYTGADFSVRVQPRSREAVSVIYSNGGTELALDGERVGSNWEGLKVVVPADLNDENVAGLVAHLETAFQAMNLEYLIIRMTKSEQVSEADRSAALGELRKMGLEVEPSTDRTQLRLEKKAAAQRSGSEANVVRAQRILSLVRDAHGTRPHYEILAKSKKV